MTEEHVMSKLSKKAREEYEKLQANLRAIVESDSRREPKLTEIEKAEIAEREKIITRLEGVLPRLESAYPPLEKRVKELNLNAAEMVVNGGDPVEIAREYIVSKHALAILDGALNLAYSDKGQAENEIERIKSRARKRELAHDKESVK